MQFLQYDAYDEYGATDDHHDYSSYQTVPEVVRKFIIYLRNCINDGMIFEIQHLYETSYPKLSEQFFEKSTWPPQQVVANIIEKDDPLFFFLYNELYFRHIYARLSPNITQRFNSFMNYCDLFNYILDPDEPAMFELPDQWLWELIDEFVYQFQSFAQYNATLSNKTPEEREILQNNNKNKYWDILYVLNFLHCLIDRSKIKSQLEVYASGGDPDSVAGQVGKHSLYKMLGYFSLVGLLRLHSLLGDYYQAIKVNI